VQPITTKPSVGSKDGVGVVIDNKENSNSDSVFSEQQYRKTLLTVVGMESGKVNNTKVIDNFETFPESINTPSSNVRFRSYSH
jgi:hypothetical protein